MKVAPKLRFASFKGNWSLKTVGEIATLQRGFDLPKAKRRSGLVPIVSSAGVSGYHDIAKVQPPGIVTGRYGSIGEMFLLEEPFWPLNTALWVKDFHDNYVTFCYYLLGRIDLKKLSDKTGVPGINRNDVHKLSAGIPSLQEQKKIANFLRAVDEKIAGLRERERLLTHYKKGVMQKIFTQTLRFKADDGSDFPDWKHLALSRLCRKESSVLKASELKPDANYPVYGADGISGYLETYSREAPYVSIVKDGAGVGRLKLCEAKTSTVGTLDNLLPLNQTNVTFLYYLLLQVRFTVFVVGSTIPHIYFRDYGKLKLSVPHPDEQQKIADFFSAIDDKITTVSAQITQMQNFKKGLLQQMFV